MKLDINCVRDVLLELEKQPFQKRCDINYLISVMPNYQAETIMYTCNKLYEAKYISGITDPGLDNYAPSILVIYDITYEGHQFLEHIRSESIWTHVKEIAKKVGSHSISTTSQIAVRIISELIKAEINP